MKELREEFLNAMKENSILHDATIKLVNNLAMVVQDKDIIDVFDDDPQKVGGHWSIFIFDHQYIYFETVPVSPNLDGQDKRVGRWCEDYEMEEEIIEFLHVTVERDVVEMYKKMLELKLLVEENLLWVGKRAGK